MQIKVSSVLTVSEPPKELRRWCAENLVVDNPDYEKKLRMNLWLWNTPKKIALFEERAGNLILPFGVLSDVRRLFPGVELINGFAPADEVDFAADIPLYDYQETAVREMLRAGSGILQAPAGSGKTQMGLALAAKIGRRTLWLCHTRDLVNQSKARAMRYMDDGLIGTITEGKVNIGRGISFATVQTMCRLDLPRYENCFDTVIVDECHRAAGSPTRVTQYQRTLNGLSARHKYGLSATVHRSDGMIKATYALLGGIRCAVPPEAVADKILQVTIAPFYTGVPMDLRATDTDGVLNYQKFIDCLAENDARNEMIVSCIADERKPSLILSDRLFHLDRLMNMLPSDMREKAVMISGRMTSKTEKAEREKAIEDMRTGKKQYLFATYSLAKEGLDIPRLERLFMATPVKDFAVVTQSVGRVARAVEGKDTPVVCDFVDAAPYAQKMFKKRVTAYNQNNCIVLPPNASYGRTKP